MYYWCVVANGKVVVMVMWYSKVMVVHEIVGVNRVMQHDTAYYQLGQVYLGY